MKRYSLLFILSILVSGITWAQVPKTVHERVYVQTDKSSYLAGELVWIKMILTDDSGAPFAGSKVGYVELLDKGAAQVQVKLELTNGVGEGWLMIPLTLQSGNYRLVGYTRYMRNEGERIFFEKILPVVNTFSVDKTLQISDDIQPAMFEPIVDDVVSIQTDKSVYTSRSVGEVQINGLPGDLHSLSVSIAGHSIIPVPAQTGLKQWKGQLGASTGNDFSVQFQPEYEGHILTAAIKNMTNNDPVITEGVTPLLAFTGDKMRLYGGRTDKDANVMFYTNRISGTHEIVTSILMPSMVETVVDDQADPQSNQSVESSSTGVRYRVDIQSPFANHTDKSLPDIQLNPAWNDYWLNRSLGLQVLHSFLADSMSRTVTKEPFFQWKPHYSYKLDEYTRFTTMEEVTIEFIPALRFRRISGKRHLSVLNEERTAYTVGNSLVLMDGVPVIDHEHIFRYDPHKVEKIEVYRGKYLFGGQMFDGIATFFTYEHNYTGLTMDPSTQFFDYEGTQAHRIFYAPAYVTEEQKNSPVPDYRHTLLWCPEVKMDGKTSVAVPFSTSDLKGDFVITVEGVARDGQIISATKLIRVD